MLIMNTHHTENDSGDEDPIPQPTEHRRGRKRLHGKEKVTVTEEVHGQACVVTVRGWAPTSGALRYC